MLCTDKLTSRLMLIAGCFKEHVCSNHYNCSASATSTICINENIRILASIRHIVAKTKGYVGLRNIIHLTISSNPHTATSTTQGPLPQPNAYWQHARFQQQAKSHTRRQGKNNAKRPCCETCIWSILQSILWWTEHSPWEASCTVNQINGWYRAGSRRYKQGKISSLRAYRAVTTDNLGMLKARSAELKRKFATVTTAFVVFDYNIGRGVAAHYWQWGLQIPESWGSEWWWTEF